MLFPIVAKTYSDREYNEDVFGYGDSFWFVIDGATGLGENNYMQTGDDARWFVQNVCAYLQEHLHSEKSVVSCLEEITSRLLKEYEVKTGEKNAAFMPCACISLFRIIDDEIEYYGLGDSVGVIEFVDGSTEVLFDQNLVDVDAIAITEMMKISQAKGISPIAARKEIQDVLIANRGLLNQKNGYYSLELTGMGIHHAICKKWKVANVKRLACMSDGFYEIMEFGLYSNIKDLLDAVDKNVDFVFQQLYEAQEKDAQGYQVPRFKVRDDTTVVYTKIKED